MQEESAKNFVSSIKQSQRQRRQGLRGRLETGIVVSKKSLQKKVASFTLVLGLLLCSFQVYAFQPAASPQPTMMMRILRRRTPPCSSVTSARLFTSVATTNTAATNTAAADTTKTTTTKSSSSSSSIVELKYMEYLPHDEKQHPAHPPIVFLHGLLGNKKNFATIATSLGHQLKKKRRIIGLDLRNHGDNHHDWRESMNYSEMAQDLLAFLDTHNIPKAVLVGHSMGGKVAQAVALTQPSRVDGLVVLDIAPVAYSKDEPHWKAVQDIVTVLAQLPVGPGVTRRDVDIQLRSAIPDPALRAFCLTNFDANKGEWKIHIQAICAQLDEIASFDITGGIPSPLLNNNGKSSNGEEQQQQQYPGDAFFIHGGQSRFVRHAYIPAIQSYFPNHMLTTVRGAGHWIHAEKPEDTIALLKRFLER